MADFEYMTAEKARQKWAFEIPPAPVPENEIKETRCADVVVVGEGFSGLCTALSALETGLSVTVVTGGTRPDGRGGSIFAAYSKAMERAGYPRQEVENFYLQEFASNAFQVDQRKWYKFYNHSEEAMNWLIDKMEAAGFQTVFEDVISEDPMCPDFQPYGTHGFVGGNISAAGRGITLALAVLEKDFLAKGGSVVYHTVARQLERENGNSGRVCAVLAQQEDGAYVRFRASKAVVLATGDFSANPEMMAKYCPNYAKYFPAGQHCYDVGFSPKGLYRGDGHLMALWAGAAWQRTYPNAVMVQGSTAGGNLPYAGHRGLRLNNRGERYCNEDMNAPYTALTVIREPGGEAFAVWGSNYAYDLPWRFLGFRQGDPDAAPEAVIERWEKQVASGRYKKSDTIEGLVEQLGLPREKALAEIERYNELCRAGEDSDFHKKKKYLQELRDAPFYGAPINLFLGFSTLGGPRTDSDLRICDENDVPLGGLYAEGSMIGDMFAGCYNFRIAGHNYGLGLTFGYLTGKFIAENE